MKTELKTLQYDISHHPLFTELNDISKIRFFMERHVFAVWDFMSLLKRLQRDITCVQVPWRPSPYPDFMVRLLNQIVLGEESDIDKEGNPISHFALYVQAMKEIGADTSILEHFLKKMDLDIVPPEAKSFVAFTLDTALEGETIEVASSFFYGREKLIPEMFQTILDTLEKEKIAAPTLRYYLKRHIEVDGEEHGPLSELCLAALCHEDEKKLNEAHAFGVKALKKRQELWDRILQSMNQSTASSWFWS